MSVTLTLALEERIQCLIETGRYPNAETVVERALDVLEAQEHERFFKLRELVLAGFNSGTGEELTDELWDRLEREAEERFQRGEAPAPHVCP